MAALEVDAGAAGWPGVLGRHMHARDLDGSNDAPLPPAIEQGLEVKIIGEWSSAFSTFTI